MEGHLAPLNFPRKRLLSWEISRLPIFYLVLIITWSSAGPGFTAAKCLADTKTLQGAVDAGVKSEKMQGLEEMQSLGIQGPGLGGSNIQSLATDVQVSGPPKIISFKARPSQVDNPGTPVTFTIQASGLGELEFLVDFGDKSPQGQGATVEHVYTKAGTYVATAKVKDARGRVVEKSVTIDVKDRKPRAPKAIKILRIGR